jgi:tRNA U34 5-carboxymethylaminomethyl modifying GTPase MnmE/TrmE
MQDAASSDIERALGAISELDGRSVCEEIVSDIFSKFCVGK